jgi:hypothetical protein
MVKAVGKIMQAAALSSDDDSGAADTLCQATMMTTTAVTMMSSETGSYHVAGSMQGCSTQLPCVQLHFVICRQHHQHVVAVRGNQAT